MAICSFSSFLNISHPFVVVRISLARGFPERLGCYLWQYASWRGKNGGFGIQGTYGIIWIQLQSITYTYTYTYTYTTYIYLYLHISTYYMFLVNYNKHCVPADLPRVKNPYPWRCFQVRLHRSASAGTVLFHRGMVSGRWVDPFCKGLSKYPLVMSK